MADATTPAIPTYTQIVDPCEFGAVPYGPACDDAFAAAVAALPSFSTRPEGVYGAIRLSKPGAYHLARPFRLERPGTALLGLGDRLTSLRFDHFGYGVLIHGAGNPRRPFDVPSHWAAGDGIVDYTAQQRYVFWTRGDAHAAFVYSPFSHGTGDDFATQTAVAIDLLFVTAPGADLPNAPVLGMGTIQGARTYALFAQPGSFRFAYVAADGVPRSITIPAGSKPANGVYRLSAFVDVANGVGWGAVGGVVAQVKLSAPVPTGTTLQINELLHFSAGALNDKPWARGPWPTPAPDFGVAGLRVGVGPVYVTNTAPGSPLARTDGKPINDVTQFFSNTPTTLAWLEMTPATLPTNPATGIQGWRDIPYRMGTAAGGSAGYGFGMLVQSGAVGSGGWNLSRPAIRGVSFSSPYQWGAPLGLGATFDCRLSDIYANGGRVSVGSFDAEGSWRLNACDIQTLGDIDIRSYILSIRDLKVMPIRMPVRLVDCVGVIDGGMNDQPAQSHDRIFHINSGVVGGEMLIRDWLSDDELAPPNVCFAEVERRQAGGDPRCCAFDRVTTSKSGPTMFWGHEARSGTAGATPDTLEFDRILVQSKGLQAWYSVPSTWIVKQGRVAGPAGSPPSAPTPTP